MSWLQKRPQVSNPATYYSVGLNKTILIVGLGNIGDKYVKNRHNVGFMCLEYFTNTLEEFDKWTLKKDLKCHITSAQLGDKRVIAIKPTTLMNASGEAVANTSNFYKIDHANIVVIHDELDINFGHIRTRFGGSDAGHNGIKSITKALDESSYGRIRIGIGPKTPEAIDSKDFVLQDFSKDEEGHLPNMRRETAALLTEYIYGNDQLPAETRSFIF